MKYNDEKILNENDSIQKMFSKKKKKAMLEFATNVINKNYSSNTFGLCFDISKIRPS